MSQHAIANKLIDTLNIDPDSALAALARYACQPTKFRRVPNRKAMQREAGKQLNRFRKLSVDAVIAGVKEEHLIAASRANLRLSKVKCSDGEIKLWSGEFKPHTHLYRLVAADLLDNAIDLAKAENFKPAENRDYKLSEIKSICARAGSRFFKELERGERAMLAGPNIVQVKNRRGESKFYRFVPKIGGVEFIGNTLPK